MSKSKQPRCKADVYHYHNSAMPEPADPDWYRCARRALKGGEYCRRHETIEANKKRFPRVRFDVSASYS